MSSHNRHEEVGTRSQFLDSDTLALKVVHRADGVIGDQFKAADMHAGNYGDRSAAIDRGDKLRGKMLVEIDPAACDRVVNLYSRWSIDKADLSEALSVQQLLRDKLRGMADRGRPQEAHRRNFERFLRGVRSLP